MAELDTSSSGGHKGGKKRAKKSPGRVDLTAMVDLGFLLITFFMLTTTMNKPKAMDIVMPSKDKILQEEIPEVAASKVLNLIIGKEDKLYWYESVDGGVPPQMEIADLTNPMEIEKVIIEKQKKVAAKWGNANEMIALIKTMPDAKYKNLVFILDEMPVTKTGKYAIVELAKPEQAMVEQLYSDPNFKNQTEGSTTNP